MTHPNTPPTGAYRARDYTIVIGEVDYSNQFTKARLVPSTDVSTLTTLVPNGVVVDVGATIWTLEITGVEDWKTGGLAKALYDARGTQLDALLIPKNGAGNPEATFTFLAVPMGFGNAAGDWNTGDYTFNVVGEPTFGEESS